MFQAQNRETINSTWKVAVSFNIIMTTSVTDRVSHNIALQDQDQDQDQDHSVQNSVFLVLSIILVLV